MTKRIYQNDKTNLVSYHLTSCFNFTNFLLGTVQSNAGATGFIPDTGSNWFDRNHQSLDDNVGKPFIPGPSSPLSIYNKPEVLDPFYAKTNVFHHHHHFIIPIHKHVKHIHHHHHHEHHHHHSHPVVIHEHHHTKAHHVASLGHTVVASHGGGHGSLDAIDINDINGVLNEMGHHAHASQITFDPHHLKGTHHGKFTSFDIDIPEETHTSQLVPNAPAASHNFGIDPSVADTISVPSINTKGNKLPGPMPSNLVAPGPLAEQTGYGLPNAAAPGQFTLNNGNHLNGYLNTANNAVWNNMYGPDKDFGTQHGNTGGPLIGDSHGLSMGSQNYGNTAMSHGGVGDYGNVASDTATLNHGENSVGYPNVGAGHFEGSTVSTSQSTHATPSPMQHSHADAKSEPALHAFEEHGNAEGNIDLDGNIHNEITQSDALHVHADSPEHSVVANELHHFVSDSSGNELHVVNNMPLNVFSQGHQVTTTSDHASAEAGLLEGHHGGDFYEPGDHDHVEHAHVEETTEHVMPSQGAIHVTEDSHGHLHDHVSEISHGHEIDNWDHIDHEGSHSVSIGEGHHTETPHAIHISDSGEGHHAETPHAIHIEDNGHGYSVQAEGYHDGGEHSNEHSSVEHVAESDITHDIGHDITDHFIDNHEVSDHGVIDHGLVEHGLLDHGFTDNGAVEHEIDHHAVISHEGIEGVSDHGIIDYDHSEHEIADHEVGHHTEPIHVEEVHDPGIHVDFHAMDHGHDFHDGIDGFHENHHFTPDVHDLHNDPSIQEIHHESELSQHEVGISDAESLDGGHHGGVNVAHEHVHEEPHVVMHHVESHHDDHRDYHDGGLVPEIREGNIHSNVVPEYHGDNPMTDLHDVGINHEAGHDLRHGIGENPAGDVSHGAIDTHALSNEVIAPEHDTGHGVGDVAGLGKHNVDMEHGTNGVHGFDEHGGEFFIHPEGEHHEESPAITTQKTEIHAGDHSDENNVHMDAKDEELLKKAKANEIIDPPFLTHLDPHGDGFGEGVVGGPDLNVGNEQGSVANGPVASSFPAIVPNAPPFVGNHPATHVTGGMISPDYGTKRQNFEKGPGKGDKNSFVSIGTPKQPLQPKSTTLSTKVVQPVKSKLSKFVKGSRRAGFVFFGTDRQKGEPDTENEGLDSAFATVPNVPRVELTKLPSSDQSKEKPGDSGKIVTSGASQEQEHNITNSTSSNVNQNTTADANEKGYEAGFDGKAVGNKSETSEKENEKQIDKAQKTENKKGKEAKGLESKGNENSKVAQGQKTVNKTKINEELMKNNNKTNWHGSMGKEAKNMTDPQFTNDTKSEDRKNAKIKEDSQSTEKVDKENKSGKKINEESKRKEKINEKNKMENKEADKSKSINNSTGSANQKMEQPGDGKTIKEDPEENEFVSAASEDMGSTEGSGESNDKDEEKKGGKGSKSDKMKINTKGSKNEDEKPKIQIKKEKEKSKVKATDKKLSEKNKEKSAKMQKKVKEFKNQASESSIKQKEKSNGSASSKSAQKNDKELDKSKAKGKKNGENANGKGKSVEESGDMGTAKATGGDAESNPGASVKEEIKVIKLNSTSGQKNTKSSYNEARNISMAKANTNAEGKGQNFNQDIGNDIKQKKEKDTQEKTPKDSANDSYYGLVESAGDVNSFLEKNATNHFPKISEGTENNSKASEYNSLQSKANNNENNDESSGFEKVGSQEEQDENSATGGAIDNSESQNVQKNKETVSVDTEEWQSGTAKMAGENKMAGKNKMANENKSLESMGGSDGKQIEGNENEQSAIKSGQNEAAENSYTVKLQETINDSQPNSGPTDSPTQFYMKGSDFDDSSGSAKTPTDSPLEQDKSQNLATSQGDGNPTGGFAKSGATFLQDTLNGKGDEKMIPNNEIDENDVEEENALREEANDKLEVLQSNTATVQGDRGDLQDSAEEKELFGDVTIDNSGSDVADKRTKQNSDGKNNIRKRNQRPKKGGKKSKNKGDKKIRKNVSENQKRISSGMSKIKKALQNLKRKRDKVERGRRKKRLTLKDLRIEPWS